MKQGRVCEKHNEFSPDGVCRWCPPEPVKRIGSPFADAARAMLDEMNKRMLKDLGLSDAVDAPPLPIATCLHDGAFFQLDGTNYSCVTCGKVFTPDGPKTATEAAILAGYGLH